ncbi:heterogeneous nuclear ribonucleoprotein A/B isoform X2 [Nematostella vectensis]|uniref:heterogeneous nuclear ribonucleoprotein A/B isoform X2 n=1 Tax=Nematostella vectensis TaxID=45351 RepID=UPI00138FE3E3|nr:heterogeneous nuclear ribonucleoprotein A/B isoform X2 [Nematostella vectensis]
MSAEEAVNGYIGTSLDSNKTRMTKDDDIGKLFVGGLSYETTKESLKEYFSKYGELVGVDIKMDALTGRPRGFAFVQFKHQSEADAVLNQVDPHVLDGRTIDPKPAAPIGKPPHLRVKKIFVGGLKPETSDEKIREYFGKAYAPVKEIEYITEHSSNRRRGFCFVSFDSEDTVDKICETQFHNIEGNKVEVKRALPKEVQQQQAALRAAAGRGIIPALAPYAGVVTGRIRPTAIGRGTLGPRVGLSTGAYPSYTALYGAFGANAAAFDPALYGASYVPGLSPAAYSTAYPAGFPAAYEYGTYGAAASRADVRYTVPTELRPSSFGPIAATYARHVFHPYAR